MTFPSRLFPRFLAPAALCLFLAASPARALFDRGGELGVGTRAMGLAGAFVAVADDPSASYWNPAGIAQLSQPEIYGMFGSYFNDKDENAYLSFEGILKNDIHFGVSANTLFYTDIPGSHEDQYTFTAAIPLDKGADHRWFAGLNARYLFADTGSSGQGTVQGVGVDLGLLFKQPLDNNMRLNAGLVLTDVSTTIRFDQSGEEQSIPSILTPGVAFYFDPETLLDVDVPWTLDNDVLLNEQNVRIRSGIEHWFLDGRLGLRGGFTSFLTLPGDFSLGASYRNQQWSIEYAFMTHSDNLGNSHRLSVNWDFEGPGGPPQPKPFIVASYVGDQMIYLKWGIPQGSQADGYYIYLRTDSETDFHRAKQQPLTGDYCLLRGAQNGVKYHLYVRSVVGGEEKYRCDEWITIPRPMSDEARHFYDAGVQSFNANDMPSALFSTRKAEEMDPNNYEIKDLLRKMENTHHEGLVPESGTP
jgi:hypothetical protein